MARGGADHGPDGPARQFLGYEFKVGTRYLVVAEASAGGRLAVSRCGLTRPFSEAVGLVDYLRLPVDAGTIPPVRIWGQVTRASRWTAFEHETGSPGARCHRGAGAAVNPDGC